MNKLKPTVRNTIRELKKFLQIQWAAIDFITAKHMRTLLVFKDRPKILLIAELSLRALLWIKKAVPIRITKNVVNLMNDELEEGENV